MLSNSNAKKQSTAKGSGATSRLSLLFLGLTLLLGLPSCLFSSGFANENSPNPDPVPTIRPAAAVVCLRVDGEGLPNGASLPGWSFLSDSESTTIAAITSGANPSAVHSGSGAVRVNGDFYRGRELDTIARGIVTALCAS